MAVPEKVIAVVCCPAQIVCEVTVEIVGVTATVIVKVTGVPGQVPSVGVTVMFEVIEVLDVFVPVKAAIFPFPDAPNPVVVLSFDQVYVAPLVPENVIAVVCCPAQIVWFCGVVIVGTGLTVIEKVIGVPVQVPETGVTVMVPEIALDPVFVPVKAAILPVPLAPSPIFVFEFDQL